MLGWPESAVTDSQRWRAGQNGQKFTAIRLGRCNFTAISWPQCVAIGMEWTNINYSMRLALEFSAWIIKFFGWFMWWEYKAILMISPEGADFRISDRRIVNGNYLVCSNTPQSSDDISWRICSYLPPLNVTVLPTRSVFSFFSTMFVACKNAEIFCEHIPCTNDIY